MQNEWRSREKLYILANEKIHYGSDVDERINNTKGEEINQSPIKTLWNTMFSLNPKSKEIHKELENEKIDRIYETFEAHENSWENYFQNMITQIETIKEKKISRQQNTYDVATVK